MEKARVEEDISVFYLTAKSFPDGVMEAYEKLRLLIPDLRDRKFFGISSPNEKGEIIYKAAAEELEPGEAARLGCETFVIKKGAYISITIRNHFNDPSSIGNAFQKLISQPDIDPKGYCLEWYLNYTDNDVKCMVPLIA